MDDVIYSDELGFSKRTVMVYGASGSGKTHFLGTFPGLHLFVPSFAVNEALTLGAKRIPIHPFGGLSDMLDKLRRFADGIESGEIVDCATVGFDNLTSALIYGENELREDLSREKNRRQDRIRKPDYGKLANIFVEAMLRLHSLDKFIVWTADQKIINTYDNGGNIVSSEGLVDLVGKGGAMIRRQADWLFHLECDADEAGEKYVCWTRPHDCWYARMRGIPKDLRKAVPKKIEKPSYNKLAKYLGWPGRKEVEADLDMSVRETRKKRKKTKKT